MGDRASMRTAAFVGLGILLGAAAVWVARAVPETEPMVAARPDDPGLSPELGRRMAMLEEAIRDLNASIALLVESGAPAPRIGRIDAGSARTGQRAGRREFGSLRRGASLRQPEFGSGE